MKRVSIFVLAFLLLSSISFTTFADSSSEDVSIEHSFCSEAIDYLNQVYVTENDNGPIPGHCPASFKGYNDNLSEHCMFIVSYPDHYVVYFSIYQYIYEIESDSSSPILVCELSGDVLQKTYTEDRNVLDFSNITLDGSEDNLTFSFYLSPESSTGIVDSLGDDVSLVFIPHSTPYNSFYCYNLIEIPLTYTPLPDDSFDTSLWEDVYSYEPILPVPDFSYAGEGFDYDEDSFNNAVNVDDALGGIDSNVFTAGSYFNDLFSDLISVMGLESIILLLLVVGFSFYVLGRL